MTRTANARVAGIAYLLYIAAAGSGAYIFSRAVFGNDVATQLASMAQHATQVRLSELLGMIGSFCALALAVSLYSITRVQDGDIALVGFAFRLAEGIMGAVGVPVTLALVSVTALAGDAAPTADGLHAVAAVLLRRSSLIGAWLFAIGSTAFCWLLLRGRMIPAWLAWVGVAGSALLIVTLPLQVLRFIGSPFTAIAWVPIAFFEVVVAVWFLVKGVASFPA
ncbi:MAG TPA: DUF4386 domain-containing protein [Gemmatimonadaceae bacterium]|nr:DUF4386 domain-containing protein [Gemmatimonadaceae bacterium]